MPYIILIFLAISGCAAPLKSVSNEDASKPNVTAAQETATTANKNTAPLSETAEPQFPNISLDAKLLENILLADIAARRGHLQKSVELHEQLAEETRDPRMAERATRIAVYARENEKALKAAKLWVELDPENIEARQLATAMYIRSGQPDEALVHIEKILSSTQTKTENGFMVVSALLSREKDKRSALEVMQKFVAKRQENPDAWFAYGHLAMRLGELDTAEQAVNKALELRPEWKEAIVQKARILNAQGKTAETLDYLKKSIEASPKAIEFRIVYARMLADEDRLDEAYTQFKKLNELQPGNEDALFALGFLALQLNYLDEAEAYLKELKEKGSRGYEINYYLGRLEEERNNKDDAIAWYNTIKDGEHYMNAQIRIIVITAGNGDLVDARALIDALKIQRPGQKLRLYLVEGEILVDQEQYTETMAVYKNALEDFPDNSDLLYARAMVAEKLDQLGVMESDLRQVLSRDPNNAEALNALGYTLADRTDRYEEALELINRALELRPDDFYIVDSMGWLQYRLGNYDAAVKYLRRAMDIKMDMEVAAHLGEVLWVMGDRQSARNVWQKALEADPKAKKKIILEVMKRLDQ